ncbi:hypothetical protein GJ496_008519 [Pomphorhynchus laevis]|nr:hypothetical protein GJ496_008519 [Pomphorhynchus laevis]
MIKRIKSRLSRHEDVFSSRRFSSLRLKTRFKPQLSVISPRKLQIRSNMPDNRHNDKNNSKSPSITNYVAFDHMSQAMDRRRMPVKSMYFCYAVKAFFTRYL